MNARVKHALNWLLLMWGLVAGLVAWASKRTEKLGAVLLVSVYVAILMQGWFFRPREELRKERLVYIGFAVILVFWLLLTFALFAK